MVWILHVNTDAGERATTWTGESLTLRLKTSNPGKDPTVRYHLLLDVYPCQSSSDCRFSITVRSDKETMPSGRFFFLHLLHSCEGSSEPIGRGVESKDEYCYGLIIRKNNSGACYKRLGVFTSVIAKGNGGLTSFLNLPSPALDDFDRSDHDLHYEDGTSTPTLV